MGYFYMFIIGKYDGTLIMSESELYTFNINSFSYAYNGLFNALEYKDNIYDVLVKQYTLHLLSSYTGLPVPAQLEKSKGIAVSYPYIISILLLDTIYNLQYPSIPE